MKPIESYRHPRHPWRWVLCAAALGALAACHSDPSNPAGASAPFLIKSISLKGTTAEASAVTVDQQSDSDGSADRSWQASFQLDGKIAPRSLPEDSGKKQTFVLDAKARRVSDNVVSRTRVTIVLDE